MSRISLAVLIAFLLAVSSTLVSPAGLRGLVVTKTATQQLPSIAGTWRWEGTEKKLVLTQQGGKLAGRIEYKSGPTRNVEGTVAADGTVSLTELFPRAAAGDMPDSVWQEVLKLKEDPRHPGFLRGQIDLKFTSQNNEMVGDRLTFIVDWRKSTGKLESLKQETEPAKFTQILGSCGPDVTANTLSVLKDMADLYVQSPQPTRDAACTALVAEDTVAGAWDINELYLGSGAYPGSKVYTGISQKGEPSRWELMTGGTCCLPRYPCGKTVEFFGECHDMQVVNYTMWGMTKALCSEFMTINTKQWAGDFARNMKSPTRPDQVMMTKVGESYGRVLIPVLKDPVRLGKLVQQYQSLLSKKSLGSATPADVDRFEASLSPDDRKVVTSFDFRELKAIVASHQMSSQRDTRLCEPVCEEKISAAHRAGIRGMKFTFRWINLNKKALPPTLKPK